MGAELIVGILEMPGNKEPNWSAARVVVNKVCRSRKRAAEVFRTAEQIGPDELDHDPEDVKKRIRRAFDSVKAAWDGQLRSWVKTHTVHSTLLITGDMTWGDSPDGCTDIEFFWASGAAEAAGFVFGRPAKEI